MLIDTDEFVIVGVTRQGEAFGPKDWAERLCETVTQGAMGLERGLLAAYVRPIHLSDGVAAVVVDARTAETDARAYRLLRRYADDNDLVVRPGRAFDRNSIAGEEGGGP